MKTANTADKVLLEKREQFAASLRSKKRATVLQKKR